MDKYIPMAIFAILFLFLIFLWAQFAVVRKENGVWIPIENRHHHSLRILSLVVFAITMFMVSAALRHVTDLQTTYKWVLTCYFVGVFLTFVIAAKKLKSTVKEMIAIRLKRHVEIPDDLLQKLVNASKEELNEVAFGSVVQSLQDLKGITYIRDSSIYGSITAGYDRKRFAQDLALRTNLVLPWLVVRSVVWPVYPIIYLLASIDLKDKRMFRL